ncbi:MAG: histidine kinase [Bacteroidales bacterium]|nr:histidine kinase [Bacteroidales bacterium]
MKHTEYKYSPVRLLTAVFLLLFSMAGVDAQSYVLTNYTSRDGIGHDHVRSVVADSTGFIWMATWDGLTRYDGTDFVNYFHDPADSTTIPYFSVNSVVIDAINDLWLTTDNGVLCKFDRAVEEFRVIRMLNNHSMADLVNFAADPDGLLWFVLRSELLSYDPLKGKTTSYLWSQKLTDLAMFNFSQFSITFGDADKIWLTGPVVIEASLEADTLTGEGRAVIRSVNSIKWQTGRPGTFFGSTGMSRITRDSEGNLWLASLKGLFRYDREQSLFTEYGGSCSNLTFRDTIPMAFYSHDSGINIWLPARNRITTIPKEITGLPTAIFFYDDDMLWFATQTEGNTYKGITKAVFTSREFRHIAPYTASGGELNIFGIAGDSQGALWLAARDRNYLIRITAQGKTEKLNILIEEEQTVLWHPRAFLPHEKGMWIGYYFNRLVWYDAATRQMEEYSPAAFVHTLCYDSEGGILIADHGMKRFDPETGAAKSLYDLGDTINIFTLHRQGDILWAGCNYSYLMRLDLVTRTADSIKITRGTTNIEDICDGDDGVLWLATLGTGVCRYDPAIGERFFYTTASGLSNNTTYSLLRDYEGNIWASTNNGISVINPDSELIRVFGENDGLRIHEFNSDASWVTGDGRFILGGVGGAVEFDPAQILSGSHEELSNDIVLEKLEVSAIRKFPGKPLYRADTITIEKGNDNFHLSFTVPEYRHPEKIRYRYRINGDNNNWYYTDHSDRNINFSNLKPGWYDLETQATDFSGSWSISRKIAIHMKPYFYQTTLFRIALPVTVLFLLTLLPGFIISQLRHREQQKRDALRQQALRGQMNPHFIFNAMNSINYFISNNDRRSANRYISDFAKLIRTVLNNMNEDYVRLSAELELLEDYLEIEHLRFGDKFDYTLHIDPRITPEAVMVSPGFVQPFVENAIWHGLMGLEERKGTITVDVTLKEKTDLHSG